MRLSRNKYRMIYSSLLIAAFFIPAYSGLSAFGFIRLAIGAVRTDAEVTIVDLLVIVLPLLFIFFSSLVILLRAIKRKPLNGLLLSLPLFFLLFFFLIISVDRSRQLTSTNLFNLMRDMSPGGYIAAFASVLLLFSYSRREALNLSSK